MLASQHIIRSSVHRLPAARQGFVLQQRNSVTVAASSTMPSIGTHSGTFHCDEALGCYLLRLTEQFKDAPVLRSRSPEALKPLDVVIDVGGVYSPEQQRYDHHQRGFHEVFGHGYDIKLSSAGLVYKHYGKSILASIMGLPADHQDVQTVYLAVYKNFIQAVDAIDNGVNQWDVPGPPRYTVKTDLSSRVAALNPRWNEELSPQEVDGRFSRAMELTGKEFLESVDYLAKAWLPGRAVVEASLQNRHEVDSSGEIIQLPTYAPWKDHIYDLEEELSISPLIKFCLYEDTREQAWRLQAVSLSPGVFENRKSLPGPWRGLRDEELSQTAGIPGCIFVHASGFIGGNKTLEGALEMARQALRINDAAGDDLQSKRTKLT